MSNNGTVTYEDVVLGRYYIDNWIMGMIRLNQGYLIDATKAGSLLAAESDCSARNSPGSEHILEKVPSTVYRIQGLFLQ